MELVKYVDQLFKRYILLTPWGYKKIKIKNSVSLHLSTASHFILHFQICVVFPADLMQLSAPYLQRPYTYHHTVFMCLKRNYFLVTKTGLWSTDFSNYSKRGIL